MVSLFSVILIFCGVILGIVLLLFVFILCRKLSKRKQQLEYGTIRSTQRIPFQSDFHQEKLNRENIVASFVNERVKGSIHTRNNTSNAIQKVSPQHQYSIEYGTSRSTQSIPITSDFHQEKLKRENQVANFVNERVKSSIHSKRKTSTSIQKVSRQHQLKSKVLLSKSAIIKHIHPECLNNKVISFAFNYVSETYKVMS